MLPALGALAVRDAGPAVTDGALLARSAHPASGQPWDRSRALHLQHASDAITWRSPDSSWTVPADQRFAEGLEVNPRDDSYTLLTVAYASVLFFAGMSAKVRSPRSQWVTVGVAVAFFLSATRLVGTFATIL